MRLCSSLRGHSISITWKFGTWRTWKWKMFHVFFFLLATFWLSQWSDVLLLYLECDSMTMTFRFSNFHRPPCHSFLLFSISLSIRESWLRNKKIYLWTHLHSSQEIIRYENISNAAHRIGTHESAQSSSPTQFDAVLFLFENSIWCSIQIQYFIHLQLNSLSTN